MATATTDDLVLSTATRATALLQGLNLGSAALRVIARTHEDVLVEAWREALPWLAWLPEADETTCVHELTDDLAASAATNNFVRFHNNVTAWKDTAEIWSDPDLAARLGDDFAGDAGPVPRPAA